MPKLPADSLYLRPWRKARGMTVTEVAAEVGRDPSVVSKWERNKTPISLDMVTAYARAVKTTPAALFEPPGPDIGPETPGRPQNPAATLALNPENSETKFPSEPGDLPVYKTTLAPGGSITLTFEQIETIAAPKPLAPVAGAFGLYVVGDDMSPAYEAGDMILIHPTRPATKGCDVLVTEKRGETTYHARIMRLADSTADSYTFKSFNPVRVTHRKRTDPTLTLYVIAVRYTGS